MSSPVLSPSKPKYEPKHTPDPLWKNWKFWAVILLVISVVVASLKFDDVVEYGEDGKPRIKPERTRRLADTIRYYEGAEQYVLVATKAKFYLCPSCPHQDSIFLWVGEVWKYGTTINGQSGRYKTGLPDPSLDYQIQFAGALARCKSEEQLKIVYYPALPENLKRKDEDKLARPPGNPYDN